MKKFLINLVLFITPIMLMACVMEFLIREIPNDYSLKKNYLKDHSDNIQTLVLGSSHAFYGVDPKYFSVPTFNASQISQSLDLDQKILFDFGPNLKNLHTIIIPISYFTYFAKLSTGVESWRVKNYYIYYNLEDVGSLHDHFEITSNRFDINTDRLKSFYLKKRQSLTCSDLGWGIMYNSKKALDLNETGTTAAMRHSVDDVFSHENLNVFKENLESIHSILQFCKANNIRVFLFTPPAFHTYSDNLNQIQLNLTVEQTKELASVYSDCKYLNLLNNPNFVATDFYDADHLSEIGAEKLSLILNEWIVKSN